MPTWIWLLPLYIAGTIAWVMFWAWGLSGANWRIAKQAGRFFTLTLLGLALPGLLTAAVAYFMRAP